MLTDHLIAPSGSDKIAFPVKIIDDDLDKLHFRMLRQNLIQYLRRIVEGKSEMSDLPFFFPFLCMLKQMTVLNNAAFAIQPIVEFRVQNVEQVIICLCQVRNKKIQLLAKTAQILFNTIYLVYPTFYTSPA